jgi:hypothetical protein
MKSQGSKRRCLFGPLPTWSGAGVKPTVGDPTAHGPRTVRMTPDEHRASM